MSLSESLLCSGARSQASVNSIFDRTSLVFRELLPCAAVLHRSKERLDNAEGHSGVLDRPRRDRFAAQVPGETIYLQRVLVHWIERESRGFERAVARMIADEDVAWSRPKFMPHIRKVAAQPTGGTQDRKLLVREERRAALCAHGKACVARSVIEDRRRKPVDPELGIAVDRGDHARGRKAEYRARRADSVGPQVIKRAASLVGIVADVVRIEKLLGERALQGAWLSNGTGAQRKRSSPIAE